MSRLSPSGGTVPILLEVQRIERDRGTRPLCPPLVPFVPFVPPSPRQDRGRASRRCFSRTSVGGQGDKRGHVPLCPLCPAPANRRAGGTTTGDTPFRGCPLCPPRRCPGFSICPPAGGEVERDKARCPACPLCPVHTQTNDNTMLAVPSPDTTWCKANEVNALAWPGPADGSLYPPGPIAGARSRGVKTWGGGG